MQSTHPSLLSFGRPLGVTCLIGLLTLSTVGGSLAQRAAPDRPTCRRLGRPCDFATFENRSETAHWKATGGATVRQSTEFPSWQTHSLRVDVPAGATGGVETSYVPRPWHRYEALQFFVYAEQPGELKVELSDGTGLASQAARLKKGSNHVQLRLKEFTGVKLSQIDRLRVVLSAGTAGASLFLDRFSLAEFNEVLAKLGRMDAPYGMDLETPHVKLANPYARGPVRVLIVPDVAHGRSAIELAQRLECTLYPVTLGVRSSTNRWGFGDFYGRRGNSYGAPFTLAHTYLADQLLNGPEYDVMVLPGTRPWEEFPEVVRRAIRERVEGGMGLVLVDMTVRDPTKASDLFDLSPLRPFEQSRSAEQWEATNAHYITRNVPLTAFPYEQMQHTRCENSGRVLIQTDAGDPILAVKDLGKGRVVAAAYAQRGLIPLIENQFEASATWHYWEYMYSLLARSVVWAARKEPEGAVEAIQFDSSSDPKQVRITLAGPRDPQGSLEVKVLNEHWQAEKTTSRSADATVELELPTTPSGPLHFVNAVLRDKNGKIGDWGSSTYTTALPAQITEIRFTSDRFQLGTPVTGQFEIRGAEQPDLILQMNLFDNYGRLLAQRESPIQPAPTRIIPFSLSSEGVLTRLAWIEGRVLQNGGERHRKRRDVFILQPRKWDDYDVVMYLFGPDPAPGLWDTVQQRLKEMRVTTLSSYPLELSKHANFGVQAQTRISGQESPDGAERQPYLQQKRNYERTKDKKYLARLFCLNDPAYLKQQEREIDQRVAPWVPFSPMSYYIYEEPSLTCYEDAMDLCFSQFCMRKMRDWLKGEYGTLENVNRKWGTEFARWQDIVPDTTEEAQKRGNYASWADHRTFMEKTYAENYAYVRELLHRHDPEGLVLLSGTQESAPHNGCDYYQLDQIVGHLNPYTGGNQLEFHRSFNPQLRSSAGTGYGAHGRRALYNLYSGLYHGFWAGAYVFWQYSILNPDYRFCESAKDIQKVLGEIQGEGIARLISSATRDNNRIAIHYSYPSIHGTWIPDGRTTRADENPSVNAGPTARKFIENRDGWVNVLKDLGFQFDFVAQQQIEAGELLSKDFRLLVLPFSVAVTDKEAAAIKEFVGAGGVLIADGQAGVMDGHAKWLSRGSVDELFGITRSSPVQEPELASSKPQTAVQLSGGKSLTALQGAPALIVNSHGKGKAIYLNFFLSNYVEDRRDGKQAKWKELLAQALSEAGVQPPFRVVTTGGKPLDGFELISFQSGPARYIGILKNDDLKVRTEPMTVQLGKSYHVYDVRKKTYLGKAESIADSIRTAEPKLYALLPAAVHGVRITSSGAARRGAKFSYRVNVDGGPGVNSVVVVRVYKPDGTLMREYSENVEAKSGTGSSGFNLALNDAKGTWKVVAREVASGKQATLAFELP